MNANADKIKQNISMQDVFIRYGLKLGKRGAICCPFHREKTPSFKIYQNGKKFHCFGCGEDGDVISFAMKYYGITYGQAITRLSSEFGIPIEGERPLTIKERVKIQETRKKRKQEEEFFETERNRLFDAYSLACDEFTRLEGNLIGHKPKTVTDPFNELYCEALHKLPYQRYKCDMAEIELRNFEERRTSENERNNSGTAVLKRGLSERTRAV